jgi:hypothetical protein
MDRYGKPTFHPSELTGGAEIIAKTESRGMVFSRVLNPVKESDGRQNPPSVTIVTTNSQRN